MWRSILCVLGAAVTLAWCNDDEMICEGEWIVNSVFPCPDADQYPYNVTGKKSMLNRHTDCYNVTMDLQDEINEHSHGAYLECCKKVDGGCKLQFQESPASFCNFLRQYAYENFRAALNNIGLENSDCPIPKGEMRLVRFPVDYKELPSVSIPGDFICTGYITKGPERMGCIMVDYSFKKVQND